MSKEKHIKPYMFVKLRLKCFRNITTFCYFHLMQNRQQEQDNHFHQFNIFLCHIATGQIKDIQPWVFFCHKPYSSEVEILKFLSNFEHGTWHKFCIFLSENDKNSKNEEFLIRFLKSWLCFFSSNTNFFDLWNHSRWSYGHFDTLTPKNGKIYNLSAVPHFDRKFHFLFMDTLFSFIPFSQNPNNISAIFGFWFNPVFQWLSYDVHCTSFLLHSPDGSPMFLALTLSN